MIIYTCPICGNDLVDMCYPTYPPKYGKQCFNCGWKEDYISSEITKAPYSSSVGDTLSNYFCIPCNLCNKYFEKDGSCPREVEQCNSKEHWEMLLERINREED